MSQGHVPIRGQSLLSRGSPPERYDQMLFRTIAGAAIVRCASRSVDAQPQQPRYSFGWPCSGKVDPAYVHSAEATGGKVMLFKPTEVSGIADEMAASRGHGETVTRVASQLDEGVYDFDIPLDSTIESAYFFISLQCLQFVTVLQPAGDALQVDAPELNYHTYDAIRFFTIKAPSPGTWKVRIAGRGFFSLIVNAKADLALTSASLVQNGVPIKGLAPLGRTVRL